MPGKSSNARSFDQQDAEKDRQRRSRVAQRLNVRHRVRFASSLAAALLDGLFAHPAWLFSVVSHLDIYDGDRGQNEFFRSLLEVEELVDDFFGGKCVEQDHDPSGEFKV